MAREIDLTKKLSEDDLRYLVDRNRWDDIRTYADNQGIDEPRLPSARSLRAQTPRSRIVTDGFERIAEQLGVSVESSGEEDQGEPVSGGGQQAPQQPASQSSEEQRYNGMTVPQLKEELDKRRAEYMAGEDPDADAAAEVSYTNDDRKPDLVKKLVDDDAAQADIDE